MSTAGSIFLHFKSGFRGLKEKKVPGANESNLRVIAITFININ
jgi:hypothetical protein